MCLLPLHVTELRNFGHNTSVYRPFDGQKCHVLYLRGHQTQLLVMGDILVAHTAHNAIPALRYGVSKIGDYSASTCTSECISD